MISKSKKKISNKGQLKKTAVKVKTGKASSVAARGSTRSGRWVSVDMPVPRPTEQVLVDNAGRIVVPARFRRALGLEPGDPVTVTLEDDVLRVRTIKASLERARELMRKKNPKRRSLVDELIAERRAEAARE